MTERRRFFPSRPVQTEPGRTAELAVQLRKEPEMAVQLRKEPEMAAPVAGNPWGTWLLPQMIPNHEGLEQMEDGTWESFGGSVFRGTPFEHYLDEGSTAIPIIGDGFYCTDAVIDSHYSRGYDGQAFYGVIFGATAPVSWELSWSRPWTGEMQPGMEYGVIDFDPAAPGIFVSLYGHRASAYGSTVLLRVWPTNGSADYVDVLTARATIGGGEIAVLTATIQGVSY